MTLDEVRKKERGRILRVEDEAARPQALRLGLYEGAAFVCLEKITDGPVVLQTSGGETAVGRRLAKHIFVSVGRKTTENARRR